MNMDYGAVLDYIERLKTENAVLTEAAETSYNSAALALDVTEKQVREQTAKDIYEYLCKSGIVDTAPDTIKMYFKEKYGVEVEE